MTPDHTESRWTQDVGRSLEPSDHEPESERDGRGQRPARGVGRFHILALGAFLACGLVTIGHHELWRDELQHWSIARASQTVADVFRNLEYESSPPLWHLFLYVVTRLSHDPGAMQIAHVMLAAVAAGIFLVWSPFSKPQKLLFIFGYFPAFEYCVLSRHYVLGELLLFAFLALFPWDGKRRLWATIVLVLLAQTSLFGLMLTLACTGALLARQLLNRHDPKTLGRAGIASVTVIGVSCLWSLVQILPPSDGTLHRAWDFINPWHAMQAGTTIWRSYFPVPLMHIEFWNTNLLDGSATAFLRDLRSIPILLLQDGLSLAIFAWCMLYFRRAPDALVLFMIMTVSCLAFFYLKKLGFLRHHGHLYLAGVAAMWLSWIPARAQASMEVRPQSCDGTRRMARGRTRTANHIVTIVFAIHVGAALFAGVADRRFAFSGAEGAAQWLRDNGRDEDPLISPRLRAPAVGALLDKQAYLADEDRFGQFAIWRRRDVAHREDIVQTALRISTETGQPVILVMPKRIDEQDFVEGLSELATFAETILPYERYYLYSLDGVAGAP